MSNSFPPPFQTASCSLAAKLVFSPASLLLVLASSLALGLLAARGLLGARGWMLFLIWNLFLAWLPVVFATLACARWQTRRRLDAQVLALAGLWLLFFPNAQYLVTDLIHLKRQSPFTFIFDAGLLLFFAFNGILLGHASLRLMQRMVRQIFSRAASRVFVVGMAFAAGFGIYLGRFERWNSYDLWLRPFSLIHGVMQTVAHPLQHPEPWIFTLQFGLFILGAYWLFGRVWTRFKLLPQRIP